ncbi:MAG: hypothetical protein MUE72_02665 [Chitinophagaceae bacterium]|nr:hypothetical protein [Chitinophagaceae bacterium]
MTTNKRITSKNNNAWFDKPLNRYITITGVVTSIFVTGYKVGDFKKDLEQQLILIKREQDCNQLIQQEKEKCAEFRREVEAKQIESLKQTVYELTKIKGGKNEK